MLSELHSLCSVNGETFVLVLNLKYCLRKSACPVLRDHSSICLEGLR